jgi:ABC-type sugar transport system substrate-binding protein
MKKKKLLAVLLAAVMVTGMLAGCGSKEETSSSTTEAVTSTDSEATEATTTEASEIRVAYMAKNVVDAFAVTMNTEAGKCLDQLKEEGLIADWQLFDATTDPTIQVSETEDAINAGFNFFLLQPCEAAGSDPVVTRCAEAGIPIVVINSTTESTMEKASGYSGSDDVQAGEMMGNYIMEQIPDGGLYVHMQGVLGSSAQIDRGNGITSVLTEEAGWTSGGDFAAEWLAEKAVGFATDAITQYGDELKAIVCDNDDMSSAVQAYCNSINREDIVCIGVDGNKGPLTMVKEGTLGATVFQDGVSQVDYAINTIARALITGSTDGVEMYKTDIPFVLVTSENVDQYLTD